MLVLGARVAENKKKLSSLVNTVVLCGKQNISLVMQRGIVETIGLCWISKHTQMTRLKKHLESDSRDAIYTPKTISNSVIHVTGQYIQNRLVQCGCSVSAVTRKTYHATAMDQDRLNGLPLMNIHYTMDLDVTGINDDFGKREMLHAMN